MFIFKLVHLCVFVHIVYANHGSIDEKLGYYETLESVDIESVVKRSIGDSPHKTHVKFSALGRNFSLNLEVAKGLFTQDFKVHLVNSDGTFSDEHLDTNSFYYGTLDGEDKSEVNAFLHDGVISATISIPGESFIIEPAWRHIDSLVRASRTMMVYKGSDAKWPKEMEEAQKGGNGPNFCGAAHIDGDDGETAGVTHAHDHDEDEHDIPHSRRKRATGKKMCRLIAVADYKFYQTIAGNDIYDAANYIVGIIQKINLIYKPTNFGQGVGYGVELAMLKLHVAPTPTTTNKHYNMAQTWTNPYDLLTEFSQGDKWNDYCLAHLFTHQSFSNNVLGLAYIASSSVSKLGGICSTGICNGCMIKFKDLIPNTPECYNECFDQVSTEESTYSSGYKLRERHFQQFDDNYSDVTQQSQSSSQPLSQISNWSDEMETTLDQANATLKILNCKSSPLRGQLLSDISSMKDSTIRYYKRKADESVDSVLNIIAPGQSKELKKLIMSEPTKPPTDDELTDTIFKLYEETADNKLQTQILSIVSNKMTKGEIMQRLPDITKYNIDQARLLSKSGSGLVIEEKVRRPRERMDQEKMQHALNFFFDPSFIQIVSYGTRELSFDTGEKVTIPDVVRTSCHSQIVQMYISYCKDLNFTPLGKSSLFKILTACAASQRTNLHGLDNIAAEGVEAFQSLHEFVNNLKKNSSISLDIHNELTTTLTASRIYLKTDFKLHIQQSDMCADHCINWSLSDPKDVNFQNTCDHIHCLQCDRCQLLKDVHLKLCNIVDIMNDGDDKEEFSKLIEDAMMVIFDWKSHIVRTVNQDQFRLDTIEHLETDKALLVMDWAMKFLPLKYREKQTDWFGQRGKNWHVIVCIFRESDGSINHRTFTHVLESVKQDWFCVASLLENVIMTIKDQLPQIKKLVLRSDNAACYHCGHMWLCLQEISKRTGINIQGYCYSEAQAGKSYCDSKIAHMRTKMKSWVASGKNIVTAADMKTALDSGTASTKNGRPIYYNTGLTTTKYTGGGTVLAKQSQLVTAHGHNWGSEHDPTSGDCAPSSYFGDGKYLMYPFSVTGEDSNNDEFSSCSKTYINAVLKNKAATCFDEDTSEAPCGNGRVDSGEQCDGGYLGKFDLDPCCTTSCQFKTGSICSPSNQACCTTSCQRASAGVVCSSDVQETCTAESVCTGSSLICPEGANKPLGASCLDGGQCDGLGTCKAYCEAQGLQSCVCGDVGDSCKRCCKSASTTCAALNQTAFHQDGRPCTVGYCRQGTCINSDPSYISRFFDLIDQISFDFIAEAFKTNMVAFIQVFSLLIWVPLSCVVWCRDKRSQKWSRNELNIQKRVNRNLMVDQDGRPINRPAKKPRSDNPYLSMEPRSLSGRPYSSRSPSTKPGKSQKNKVKPNRRRKDENHLNMSRDLDGDSVA